MNQEDHIIDYLNGDLDSAEKAAFEARMTGDPALAAEVEEFRQLRGDLELYADHQRRKAEVDVVAQMVEAEIQVENEAPHRRKIPWWGIAAALVLLATLTYFSLPKYGPSHFLEQHPGQIENLGPLRSDSAVLDKEERAFQAYEAGDYETCITLLAHHPDNNAQRVLLGSAYLLQQAPDKALSVLPPVLNDPEQLEYARWLLALAHLHADQEDQARKYLEQITADPTRRYKKSEAQSILDKLNRFWR